MPSKTKKQQKFFGIVKGIKKGKTKPSYSPEAAKVAKEMTKKEIDKFAHKAKPPRKRGS